MQQAHERVLLVDDEPEIRKFVGRLLRRTGYTVVEAEDGIAALEAVAAAGDHRFDVLVTDVVMPRLGGIALAERLREQQPGIALVILSGYQGDQSPSSLLRTSRATFLGKPFNITELVAAVRSVLDEPQ